MKFLQVKLLPYSRKVTILGSISSLNRPYSSQGEVQSKNDYQFMQRSEIPMLHFQKSLPRLPIPELKKTCERYLSAQQPLLTREQFAETEKYVRSFEENEGKQLQSLLKVKDKENTHTSYISKPWFEMYLQDRQPLPINYNPLLMMNPDPRPEYNDQAIRSTNIIISSLRFMKSLQNNLLEPEVFHLVAAKSDTKTFRRVMRIMPQLISTYAAYTFKAFPLDMSQYSGLFGATRIPEQNIDRIYRTESGRSRHIMVIKNGRLYSMDVLDESGNIEAPLVLLKRIKLINNGTIDQNKEPTECNPLGAFTSENRATWASLRTKLIDLGNTSQLEKIDSALFCLCLDEGKLDSENSIPMVKQLLYGNITNRWFDKSLSVIVTSDGTAGINFEHSWGDGVAVLRYFNEIYKETTTKPFVHPGDKVPSDITESASINRLEFVLDNQIKESLITAIENHARIEGNLDMNFMRYSELNKRVCKKAGVSPDSIMQIGFQLAYYKLYGKFVATYESCSTAAFRHGRTETIRPLTMETKKFCESVHSMQNSNSASELREHLKIVSKMHNQLTKDAAMGQGFDRHLFGLKYIAKTNNLKLSMLYLDEAYQNINKNILSTSTLSSPALLAGSFGPVVSNGFGIGYNIQDEFLGSIVSNYRDETNGSDFCNSLTESFKQLYEILSSEKASKV